MKHLYDQVMFLGGEIGEDMSYERGHVCFREMRFYLWQKPISIQPTGTIYSTGMYYTMVADNTRRDILGVANEEIAWCFICGATILVSYFCY